MQPLREQLCKVKASLAGCESLSVASTDGLILATTIEHAREGELLAAVTSFLLTSCAKGLAPYQAGECRALDYRGDRQILLVRLDGIQAYAVCVLHPGSQAMGLDEPALRAITTTIPGTLHGAPPHRAPRFFLERDERCRFPVKHGGVLLGTDAEQCDVLVHSDRVAPRHLLVELVGEGVLATDLDTEHGTRINGKRLRSGNVELRAGDRISLPGAKGFTLVAINDDGKLRGVTRKNKKKASAQAASGKKKRPAR